MFRVRGITNNPNVKIIEQKGNFMVLEHQSDLSVSPESALPLYFAQKMGCRRRQLYVNIDNTGVVVQSGAMQWMLGNVNSTTGVKGVGDLVGKVLSSKVTKESAIKPEYVGSGKLMLEPTYKYILLVDVADWGSITLEDGLFLACDKTLTQKTVMRSSLSSAALGGEGLFNLSLTGNGIAALESPVPFAELIEVQLQDDTFKIDGNMAIAWSSSLQFTVERSSKTLTGSLVNGEGLVNVYRGTGRVLMRPTA